MRLTLELVTNAEQFVGPSKDRIISLRGFKIPAIENLGATHDHFDMIDLTDNDLLRLDNFPPLSRLETLMVANNRISRIAPDVFENLPNLKSLVLNQNRVSKSLNFSVAISVFQMSTLANLVPLFKAKCLERLSLMDNPVTTKAHYRHFLIYHMPTLRFLDFQHVKDAERIAAKELFSGTVGTSLLDQLTMKVGEDVPATASAPVVDVEMAPVPKIERIPLTNEQVIQLQEAIAAATTLVEVQKLEEALKLGVFPMDLKSDDDQRAMKD